jgi:hypothetical protein
LCLAASLSHRGIPARKEVENEKDDAYGEHNVNETTGNVKCEKSEQPKYDQNCGDDSKHVVISSFRARLFLPRTALTPSESTG